RRHTRSKRDWSSDVCSSDLAAAVESGSEHPIAKAIVAHAPDHPAAHDFQSEAGMGVSGTVEGHRVSVGRAGDKDLGALTDAFARSEERRVGKEGRRGQSRSM